MTKLLGKIIIEGKIKALTGLHVGGSSTGMEIGGVDNVVFRDSITGRPYIPGSSLKGSLRSLMERSGDNPFNSRVDDSWIHMCKDLKSFERCSICRVFGVIADSLKSTESSESSEANGNMPSLTRLMVRDALITDETAEELKGLDTDLLHTDVKTEVAIDRITSQATPGQIERVQAGLEFNFGMIFNVFVKEDLIFLKHVFQAMTLLENDALGGQGSRGYGKIAFEIENLSWRPTNYYAAGQGEVAHMNESINTAAGIRDGFDQVLQKIGV